MLPIGHFAFGAAMTTLLITFFIPSVQHPRLLAVMGGVWAVVLDIGRVVAHPVLTEFPMLHGADLFWLHHTLTVYIDPHESYWIASAMIVGLILATLCAEYREMADAPPVTPALETAAMQADAWIHRDGRWTVESVIEPHERDAEV